MTSEVSQARHVAESTAKRLRIPVRWYSADLVLQEERSPGELDVPLAERLLRFPEMTQGRALVESATPELFVG